MRQNLKLNSQNLLNNIGKHFGLQKRPDRHDISLLADIAHEIVLFANPDTPYCEISQRIEKLIGDAIEGKSINDVTNLFDAPARNHEARLSTDIEVAVRCTYMPWDELSKEERQYAVSEEDTYEGYAFANESIKALAVKETLSEKSKAEINKESVENTSPIKTTEIVATEEKPQKESMIAKLSKHLKLNYAFRYNVMTRESEFKRTDDSDYVVIGKREQNTIVLEAQEAGLNCWDKDVTRIIESTNTTTYHPFIEYFNNLPKWDGRDRVGELAERVSVKELWVKSFHRWMLGVAAQWMNFRSESARANCVAPILISTEQGWGKSTFCRMILPKELRRYYTESFDLSSPTACEKRLANYGLINLDEFDRYSAKKMPQLKNLMQEQALSVQLAYQRTETTLHRIASFIGTSNRRDLLTDTTGSRRFICIELEKEIDCETPIDYAQLYAQLKEELLSGARTYFTKDEEREIQQNNRTYYQSSPAEEAFNRHFRMASRTDASAVFMTASEIYKRLQDSEKKVMQGITAAKFARILSGIGQTVHTKLANGYYVVMTNGNE
jgi:predicted P-loop ATPase